MLVNGYFGPRCTNKPYATPKYGPIKSKFEVNHYRKTYYSPSKVAHIRKTGKLG